jgi:hypothetical protein
MLLRRWASGLVLATLQQLIPHGTKSCLASAEGGLVLLVSKAPVFIDLTRKLKPNIGAALGHALGSYGYGYGFVIGCGFSLLAIGYWLLAIGYWLLAIGYWLLAIGYWLLAIGYWLLAIGYWLLAIGYWLLAIGYWLLAIGYWLLAISNKQ